MKDGKFVRKFWSDGNNFDSEVEMYFKVWKRFWIVLIYEVNKRNRKLFYSIGM